MVPEGKGADWESVLAAGCHELGIRLSDVQVRRLGTYLQLLRQWNRQAGLVSPRDEGRLENRHLLDSLGLLRILDFLDQARVLDVGSGGGLPGIPLKICRPGIDLTLLEPREKAWMFLRNLLREISLDSVVLCRQRAQEAARQPDLRAGFDMVVARALAPMSRLVPLCFPFLREGGILVAYKGPRAQEEVGRAGPCIRDQGGTVSGVVPVTIPGVVAKRYFVVLQRTKISYCQG
jgi:16S rRNA (guanine527-N7)-methyltransferase